MKKFIDSIKMKRYGSEILQNKISGMSVEEELKFWKEKTKTLREKQRKLKAKAKISKS